MEPSELLRKVAGAFESLEVRYLVTGSMATIAFGEPRFTNDIAEWTERLGLVSEWRHVLERVSRAGEQG